MSKNIFLQQIIFNNAKAKQFGCRLFLVQEINYNFNCFKKKKTESSEKLSTCLGNRVQMKYCKFQNAYRPLTKPEKIKLLLLYQK